ncbi:MAG: GNAT family N-acetyltransferase [Eubacteriales bacterium]|nr:GNAT family N-acetyltransferase [Eubacteriales bacterium]
MDKQQIIKYIDDGANFYISLFGNAEHMKMVDNGFYTYVKPKEGQFGISFVFNVRLENLSVQTQKEKITEIKALGMPVWLDLLASDELHTMLFGKHKVHAQTTFAENDEVYMALLPDEKPDYPSISDGIRVIKVKTPDEFELWVKIINDLLHGGYPDMHPIYHYPLCQKGLMNCCILYKNDTPSAVAAIMNNKSITSLEFVATVPEMRRQGLAQIVCAKAIDDAFADRAEIITVRAINAVASKLYQSLGFKIYNYAI